MQNIKQKSVIILIGPPGAGKGTQAELLSERLNFYYFETSKMLEASFKGHSAKDFIEIEGEKYYFSKEAELWKKGFLNSPLFVSYLVQEKIRNLYEKGENLLLAGSPRTLLEGEKIMPLLFDLYGKENIKVLVFDISPEQTIFRNSHRRICDLIRHPILYNNETKGLKFCPLDGSALVKRHDLDDPEIIKIRLKEYKERTVPLLQYLEKTGLTIHKIDGAGSVSQVFKLALAAVN
ncbi:hypothetical protein COT20_00885 [bacterium (Candidatus Gribaldobacteria) CG08_land_8_20_14_0_20_39_15]|uniref:Adenylate kinase n=1 Tax=bacterium (Candidatus Gribaldobacteria) CG08_land_8_20_14_0_20_39_15 TaxID=2014273 RepID=A0A2M6XUY5_9BACT|nr:MAG: hypothetical protein COT20_00885 [bacterium (Candidatus Gribaldobacteria) CG08_land_8_20_14_0_20_39_15]